MATKFDNQPDADFLNCTVEQVYDFYKRYLRAADDSLDPQHFSASTFVVVDEACLSADRWQCIVCTDGPDFGEADDARVLKQVRVEVSNAWLTVARLEELTITASEAEYWARNPHDEDFRILKMAPKPPKIVPIADSDDGDIWWGLATPTQARAKKMKGIKAAESGGRVPNRGYPNGQRPMLYDE